MNLKNKVVLVTGGAVRLGRLLVQALAKEGAEIALHYNSSYEEAHELEKHYKLKRIFSANLLIPDHIDKLVKDVLLEYGKIDVLINNAAQFFKKDFFETTEENYDILMNMNLKSVFFLSQRVASTMKKEGQGCIVNMGDAGGHVQWAHYIAYCLSKAGVHELTKSMAKALAPEVRVNCVSPGPLYFEGDGEDKSRAQTTLLKKLGNPSDVVSSVLHVIKSEFMTGSIINVDGGRAII